LLLESNVGRTSGLIDPGTLSPSLGLAQASAVERTKGKTKGMGGVCSPGCWEQQQEIIDLMAADRRVFARKELA
jgi:hypothetical protein